jgi:transposase InsO family protein
LYALLRKGQKWEWTEECRKVFEKCKLELCGESVLTHYDASKEIVITCDACDEGISGILSHKIDGKERPVFYVSRTLTEAERKYPILHREALAVVFAMEKFFKYVYGNFVEIYTDHKPLLGIFNKKKGEPAVIASRLQRYIIRLTCFDYVLKYRKGEENSNADALSRLPIKEASCEDDIAEERIFAIRSVVEGKELYLDIKKISQETENDKILREVKRAILKGWENIKDKSLKKWKEIRCQLGIEGGCITMMERVVIPNSLKMPVLKILHTNHGGIVRMKNIARKYVYWHGINNDIVDWIDNCEACQVLKKDNKKKVFKEWPQTARPFQRIHMDFFHLQGKTFLIIIDAFSRWLEIISMSKTNAEAVIRELNRLFGIFGYVEEVVTDNGPPFGSYELRQFLENKGIKITHSPPYHPQSNGLAERAVQTAKTVLRKLIIEKVSPFQLNNAVEEFVRNHRNLPTTENGIVPAHLVFSFKPKTELTSLKHHQRNNSIREFKEIRNIESNNKFEVNELVWYLSKVQGHAMSYRGKIVRKNSNLTYWVKIGETSRLAHVNQLRRYKTKQYSINNRVQIEDISKYEERGVDRGDDKITENILPDTQNCRPTRTRKPIVRFQPT